MREPPERLRNLPVARRTHGPLADTYAAVADDRNSFLFSHKNHLDALRADGREGLLTLPLHLVSTGLVRGRGSDGRRLLRCRRL